MCHESTYSYLLQFHLTVKLELLNETVDSMACCCTSKNY